ncbi:ABC transporter permease [Lacticaseibacillus saniviri]
MTALIKRNLKLFFGNRSTVIFSLLGALIAFALYLIFLKTNLQQNLPAGVGKQLLDLWVMGGTLTVTAITTTQSALSQMVTDREQGQLADLLMTGTPFWQLQAGYLVSAFVVGWLMQVGMFVLMSGYFMLADGLSLTGINLGQLILLSALSSLVWTSFNLLILSFVHRVDTLGKLGTIIGTAAGFFAGVYMPIGSVPTSAQWLMKLTPAPYNAALFRQNLMTHAIQQKFSGHLITYQKTFDTMMGNKIQWHHSLSASTTILVLVGFTVLFSLLTLILARRSQRTAIVRV